MEQVKQIEPGEQIEPANQMDQVEISIKRRLYENLPEACEWVLIKSTGDMLINASQCPLRLSGDCSLGAETPGVLGACSRGVNRPADCPNLVVN